MGNDKVIIDGLVLHQVAAYFTTTPEPSKAVASFLVDITHQTALSFMAPAVFALMIGRGLLAYALIRSQLYNRWGSWIGVGIGTLAVVGYVTGLTGVYWDQMQLAGLLIMGHHLWYVWLGVAVLRHR